MKSKEEILDIYLEVNRDDKSYILLAMQEYAEAYHQAQVSDVPVGEGMIHLTKEEHKRQIITAVDYCWESNDKKGYVPNGENYYNQTFNKL